MTNDDILRMALEADAYGEHGLFYMFAKKRPEVFVRFAALVAAREREACAKVCADTYFGNPGELNHELADAIRAMGTP